MNLESFLIRLDRLLLLKLHNILCLRCLRSDICLQHFVTLIPDSHLLRWLPSVHHLYLLLIQRWLVEQFELFYTLYPSLALLAYILKLRKRPHVYVTATHRFLLD